jgi:hypothetical protein
VSIPYRPANYGLLAPPCGSASRWDAKQYALTLLIQAGVRVLCLQDSERALESHTDKLLVSVLPAPVTLSADKGRQPTTTQCSQPRRHVLADRRLDGFRCLCESGGGGG